MFGIKEKVIYWGKLNNKIIIWGNMFWVLVYWTQGLTYADKQVLYHLATFPVLWKISMKFSIHTRKCIVPSAWLNELPEREDRSHQYPNGMQTLLVSLRSPSPKPCLGVHTQPGQRKPQFCIIVMAYPVLSFAYFVFFFQFDLSIDFYCFYCRWLGLWIPPLAMAIIVFNRVYCIVFYCNYFSGNL